MNNLILFRHQAGCLKLKSSLPTCPISVEVQQQEVKAEQAPAPVKKETPSMAATKVLDGATPISTGGKKKNSAKKQKTEPGNNNNDDIQVIHSKTDLCFSKSFTLRLRSLCFLSNPVEETHILADLAASANHQTVHNDDVPAKGSGKKQKNETEKGKKLNFFLHDVLLEWMFPSADKPYHRYVYWSVVQMLCDSEHKTRYEKFDRLVP